MDAPPPQEDVRPFVAIARHLHSLGYSAPQLLGEAPEAGLLLLEDLGDDTYSRVLAEGGDETTLYAAAVDLLVNLHRHAPPEGLAPYDERKLIAEADLLIDWFFPAIKGQPVTEDQRTSYRTAWQKALAPVSSTASTLVLRDYHADNLMWLPERQGTGQVGLLDFQDALAGAPAYDLVSLLEDARRDVPPALATVMIDRYLSARPDMDPTAFRAAYALLGGQRNAKIIGIFTRLWKRDLKPAYLSFIPRVWRLLERDLAHPSLAPVRTWLDRELPPPLRRAPKS